MYGGPLALVALDLARCWVNHPSQTAPITAVFQVRFSGIAKPGQQWSGFFPRSPFRSRPLPPIDAPRQGTRWRRRTRLAALTPAIQ